jgi:hypothetical protein
MIEWELLGAFFDAMTHLVLHAVEELAICRPIHSRWMYLVERTLGTLKKYMRNRARPEASMASGYVLDETMGVCDRIHANVYTGMSPSMGC